MKNDPNPIVEMLPPSVPDKDAVYIANAIDDLLRTAPNLIGDLDASAAVAIYGRYRYFVSLVKLGGAIAGLAKTAIDPSSAALLIGLGVLGSLSSLTDSVRGISIDEAAICQALYEKSPSNGQRTHILSIDELKEKVSTLSNSEERIEARVFAAIATLEKDRVIEFDRTSNAVKLRDIVLVARRPQGRSA